MSGPGIEARLEHLDAGWAEPNRVQTIRELDRFHRGGIARASGDFELMWLDHPASRGGERSAGQAELVASLLRRPLTRS
jgi:hypothetical protein